MKQKVVIIGHGYLSRLSLIRSLGQAGFDLSVVVTMYGALNTTKPLDCYSKYVSKVYYCNAKDSEGLISILLNLSTGKEQKIVIIPDSDWSASIVDDNRDSLSEYFLFPRLDDDSFHVADWMDKERQKLLAKEIGLTVPNVTRVSVVDGVEPNLSNVHYPCFTKALTTKVGGKQCFSRSNNKEELIKALSVFANRKVSDILIEDYIDIEREYAVVGLTDGKNVYMPGVIQVIENCQCHLGIARKGKIMPTTCFEGLLDLMKVFVRRTRFVGLFDIDFLYSQGNYYFCEMNFRYGGSGYAYTKLGINLPSLFVQMITNQLDISSIKDRVNTEQYFVNEKMLLDDLLAKNITLCEFNKDLVSAEISFIKDKEDFAPQRHFRKMVLKNKVKYFMKKILQR